MNKRKGHSLRWADPVLALVASLVLGVAGCSNSGSPNGGTIEFTPAAMTSVPSLKPDNAAALTAAAPTASNIGAHLFVKQLFAMQCRYNGGAKSENYCPQATPAPPSDTFDPYQFTMTTLIGFIYHAQMYTTLVTDCSGDGFAPKTVSAGSYSAASTAAGADPTRFVLDQFSSYTCQATTVDDPRAETRVVSAAADGSYQTTLHTRYKYATGIGLPQTDFFQVDLSLNAGEPEFLAFNFASAAPHRSRLVLLANLATHRFALKYYVPSQPGNLEDWLPQRFAVAAGVGGYDLTTGAPNAGYYFIDFLDEPLDGELRHCVNNAGGQIEVGDTNCVANGVPMNWTSSSAIGTYLAVPAAHAARLAPYLAEFETAATLSSSDAWQSAEDEDLYWPASLH